jgi:hypothetical protein
MYVRVGIRIGILLGGYLRLLDSYGSAARE